MALLVGAVVLFAFASAYRTASYWPAPRASPAACPDGG
ncbi:Hypothetical protein A7982_11753 [Minicystis rosea]|nr:Hypothetical protein A7982_11753 [Minicystis rosea]